MKTPTIRASSRSRWIPLLAAGAIALWFAVALLLSLAPVTDQDLSFHVAWGRILLHNFSGARSLLLGQDPSVTVFAYSYWLYQVTVAMLLDHVGPWGLVLFRSAQIMISLLLGFLLAGSLGASRAARSAGLAFGILISYARFLDRADVLSLLCWMAALWILVRHRHDRRIWALIPLQILWVNVHHHFSLLPAMFLAFVVGDAFEGFREFRRSGWILAALILATFLNPAGPGAWTSQLKLAGVLTGGVAPFELSELTPAYSSPGGYLGLWVFRLGMPAVLLLMFAARRRLGWGAILAVLIPTVLAVLARRALLFFGVTAIALLPPALDRFQLRLPARTARGFGLGLAALAFLTGLAGTIGVANGRLLLAEDRTYLIAGQGRLQFPGTEAARFLQKWKIEGPILHTPTFAGAILMENGPRLALFLDPRWCGTRDADQTYIRLTMAGDRDIAGIWESVQSAHGYETVMLDCYHMPALVRYLSRQRGWAVVFSDIRSVVFCRRGGANDPVIRQLEPGIEAARIPPDPAREAALAAQILVTLRSPRPSPLTRLVFPWGDFDRANLRLQMTDLPGAEAAYLDLFRNEAGSLSASRHRHDILENALQMLGRTDQWEAQAALCAALIRDRESSPRHRRDLLAHEAAALEQLSRGDEAERVALRIVADMQASADERGFAWSIVAAARAGAGNYERAADALRASIQASPGNPEAYLSLAMILDLRLGQKPDALQNYRAYLSHGGQDPQASQRIRALAGTDDR